MLATRTAVGPSCHGEPVPLEELDRLDFETGYTYEIIDGRWYVAPIAGFPEQSLERWLRRRLEQYATQNPGVVGWVTNNCRVFVPDRPELTVPEPDLGLYHDDLDALAAADESLNWDDFSPFIVAEVLVTGDADKDLVRNVELYFEVPSVQEYWVLDGRDNTRQPTLLVRQRWGNRWVVRAVRYGETYTTRHLPGLELLLDPRR
jgi:Uma2 family endonuclease